jgi:hypothetical protein
MTVEKLVRSDMLQNIVNCQVLARSKWMLDANLNLYDGLRRS